MGAVCGERNGVGVECEEPKGGGCVAGGCAYVCEMWPEATDVRA